jgi:hypothetical protein
MRLKRLTLALAAAALAFTSLPLTVPANANWFDGVQGNDTGGIIPWSPETDRTYGQIAGAHCGFYNKVALVTSIHPVYGDYISFICAFPPGYDPRKGQYGYTK